MLDLAFSFRALYSDTMWISLSFPRDRKLRRFDSILGYFVRVIIFPGRYTWQVSFIYASREKRINSIEVFSVVEIVLEGAR
ncbi:hypothetical protein ACH3XW_41730 [Acanthocheilonema viteae]